MIEFLSDLAKIRPLDRGDVDALLDLRIRNRDSFTLHEPRRADPDDGYTVSSLSAQIATAHADAEAGRAYAFGVFTLDDRLVGRVALSNVVRAAWQNATLGYYIDGAVAGHGYATDAVRLLVGFAFRRAGLHRVQAGVMPRNKGSIRVLEKAGFRYEGRSLHYLQINGVWEDHDMFAITLEDISPGAPPR